MRSSPRDHPRPGRDGRDRLSACRARRVPGRHSRKGGEARADRHAGEPGAGRRRAIRHRAGAQGRVLRLAPSAGGGQRAAGAAARSPHRARATSLAARRGANGRGCLGNHAALTAFLPRPIAEGGGKTGEIHPAVAARRAGRGDHPAERVRGARLIPAAEFFDRRYRFFMPSDAPGANLRFAWLAGLPAGRLRGLGTRQRLVPLVDPASPPPLRARGSARCRSIRRPASRPPSHHPPASPIRRGAWVTRTGQDIMPMVRVSIPYRGRTRPADAPAKPCRPEGRPRPTEGPHGGCRRPENPPAGIAPRRRQRIGIAYITRRASTDRHAARLGADRRAGRGCGRNISPLIAHGADHVVGPAAVQAHLRPWSPAWPSRRRMAGFWLISISSGIGLGDTIPRSSASIRA